MVTRVDLGEKKGKEGKKEGFTSFCLISGASTTSATPEAFYLSDFLPIRPYTVCLKIMTVPCVVNLSGIVRSNSVSFLLSFLRVFLTTFRQGGFASSSNLQAKGASCKIP